MKKISLGLSCFVAVFFITSSVFGAGEVISDSGRDNASTAGQVESHAEGILAEARQQQQANSQTAEHGNADCSLNPANTKQNRAITTQVYEHIYKDVLDYGTDEADDIIKPDKSYAVNRQMVKETFFAAVKEDTDLTDLGEQVNEFTKLAGVDMSQSGISSDEVRRVREKREEYASIVAAKNLKISLDLRPKIIEDIKSVLNAETKGCNQLHGLLMENRNTTALIKSTTADIVIQILTLESLGAKMLMKEDVGLIKVPVNPNANKK